MAEQEQRLTLCEGINHEVREFAGSTTLHGVPRIVGAERKEMRYMWIIFVCLACCIFGYHLSRLTTYYLSYPVATSTAYNTIGFVFPDVTICNLLPFSLRKLERKDPGLVQFVALGSTAPEHLEEAMEVLLEGTENDKFDTILSCTYNNEECTADNFTVISDPKFKSCFTFSPTKGVMANTPEYGLNLLVYAENSHQHPMVDFSFAIRDSWESSGVRLIIHDTNTRPYPDMRGVNVQPGVSARFAVSMNQFSLYNVYRDGKWRCDDDARKVSYCVLDSDKVGTQFNEVAEDCYIDVIQGLFMSQCKCLSHDYSVPSSFCQDKPINSSTDFCDTDSSKCFNVLKEQLRSNFQEMVVSQCSGTCTYRSFTKGLSTSAWPSHVAEAQVVKQVRELVAKLNESGVTTALDEIASLSDEDMESSGILPNNFLKLCIYAESLTGNEISEKPAYPLANFISEVGGILGLWMGCSVLTILGPIEFIINICCIASALNKARKRGAANNGGAGAFDVESNLAMK